MRVCIRSGNACYHPVQNLLSSRLLSKNLKIKIHRTIILPIVLYGCVTWLLTLQEEQKLRVFENMVLAKVRSFFLNTPCNPVINNCWQNE